MLDKFNQIIEIQRYSNSTKKIYKFHIKNFLRFCNGKPKQEEILNYLQSLKDYKPSSLNIAKYSIIYFFNNILNQNITIKIPKIKREQLLPKVIDRDIIIKMIDVTKNLKHKIVIEMLYSSGIRLGEIVKLRWEDIDFQDKLVRINNGKGSKDRYSILSDKVVKDLIIYRDIRYNKDSPYVFDSSQKPNTHICKRTVEEILNNAKRKLKIKYPIFPHMMRHSLATHLVEKDVNLRKIQSILGHTNLNTTQIYTKVAKNDLIDIKNPLDDCVKSVV